MITTSIAGAVADAIARAFLSHAARATNRLSSAVWVGLICIVTAVIMPFPSYASTDTERVDEAVRGWAQSWDRGDVAHTSPTTPKISYPLAGLRNHSGNINAARA